MASEQNTFQIPDEAIDVSSAGDGGVRKLITKEGSSDATPFAGSEVTVHYTGKLTNGETFDSSVDRGTPFNFTLGEGQVIKAWDQGVASMKKGECATLYCKPEYAYGAAGSPPRIPPNSELIFEVELFSWKGKSVDGTDNKVSKQILKEGKDWSTPNEGATVEVHLKGTLDGTVFDERDESFVIGEGSERNIPKGVERAIRDMKCEEQSVFTIESEYGFGKEGWSEKNVPADADIQYEVELKKFEKAKEGWEMDISEKLEQSDIQKNKGTSLFKEGKYELARKRYEKVSEFLGEETLTDEHKERGEALLLAAHLNVAMCLLKTKDYLKAVESCNKALDIDADNEKGLFRRGQANLELQNFSEAKADFEAVLKVNSENKAAKNQLTMTVYKEKQMNDKQKKIYKGMFEKFAASNEKHAEKGDAEMNDGEKANKKVGENGDTNEAEASC